MATQALITLDHKEIKRHAQMIPKLLHAGVKYNVSAYRVLYILLMLVQYRSLTLEQLNDTLYYNPLIERMVNTETLTKYINTLRALGCDIPKASSNRDHCYRLCQNPISTKFDAKSLNSARLLLEGLSAHPDAALFQNFQQLLQKVTYALPRNEKETWQNVVSAPALSSPGNDLRRLFLQYSRYCREGQWLQVVYNNDAPFTVEPLAVKTEVHSVSLLAHHTDTQEDIMLNVAEITSVMQLPQKVQRVPMLANITFLLHGRLAQSYRCYPNERIIRAVGKGQDRHNTKNTKNTGHTERAERTERTGHTEHIEHGDEHNDENTTPTLKVKVQTHYVDDVLDRLMKYGTSCTLLSPDYVKQKMKRRVSKMLKALGDIQEDVTELVLSE